MSAGPKFHALVTVNYEEDSRLCGRFDYWGPVLIEATMLFADGASERAFIYARIPEDIEGVGK